MKIRRNIRIGYRFYEMFVVLACMNVGECIVLAISRRKSNEDLKVLSTDLHSRMHFFDPSSFKGFFDDRERKTRLSGRDVVVGPTLYKLFKLLNRVEMRRGEIRFEGRQRSTLESHARLTPKMVN